jgi:hypothetical protein
MHFFAKIFRDGRKKTTSLHKMVLEKERWDKKRKQIIPKIKILLYFPYFDIGGFTKW